MKLRSCNYLAFPFKPEEIGDLLHTAWGLPERPDSTDFRMPLKTARRRQILNCNTWLSSSYTISWHYKAKH